MTLESTVARGRAAAERRMLSRVTIRRPSSTSGTRDASGFRTGGTVVYTGPCRVGGSPASAGTSRRSTVGGAETELALRVLHLPAGTTGLTDGDVATLETGDCAGLVLRLVEVSWQDQATALRISCVENA